MREAGEQSGEQRMPDTEIRRACNSDHDAITDCVAAAYARYIPRMGMKPAPMLADYRALIERGVVYVAPSASGIRGVVVCYPVGDHMFLENVAVAPKFQGRGIGHALMQFVEQQAIAGHYREIRLYTHERMTENIAYYGKLGYRETERRTEDGYQRVFFRKELTAV